MTILSINGKKIISAYYSYYQGDAIIIAIVMLSPSMVTY